MLSTSSYANSVPPKMYLSYDRPSYRDVSCVGFNNQLRCVAIFNDGGIYDQIYYTNESGRTWKKDFVITNPDQVVGHGFVLHAVDCATYQSKPLCAAVGYYNMLGHEPHAYTFTLVNNDGSENWTNTYDSWATEIADVGTMKCFDSGLCVASGSDQISIKSLDGGNKWSNISELKLQCARSANKNFCLRQNVDESDILRSDEGSSDWRTLEIENFPSNSSEHHANSISCSNQGSNSLCVIVGSYKNDHSHIKPYIAVSTDGANTWTYQPTLSELPDGSLNAVSCSETEQPTVCTAVGGTNKNKPLIVQTTNGGTSWEIKLLGKDIQGSFSSVNCGLDKNHITHKCTAVGGGLVAQSEGTENVWNLVTLNSDPSPSYNKITCASEGQQSLCLISGSNLYQSLDERKTWQPVQWVTK
jgi:hypothetical protein